MSKTQLKKLVIEKFRALNNVEIELGDYITVVCGKNGTSKSSILGIAAQIFSFEKDYEKDEGLRNFRQVTGKEFKSKYSDHFRFSEKYDAPGSMKVGIELHDGYTDQSATGMLELMTRTSQRTGTILPRAVVRNNSTVLKGKNASRNFTHPVIFLSLKRLIPIADRNYRAIDFDYLKNHRNDFIILANELLNRQSSLATGTKGTISSAVAHGDNYNHESVSAGEDNAGQIILALMSFRKLKEEYFGYKGGLLLIDEADAGLFPKAQINLLKILDRECRNLNLQIIMTSHSPTLIEYAFEQSQKYQRKYKTVYLSDTYGGVKVMHDWSWPKISADINTKTIAETPDTNLPRINVYFEDKEAFDFFSALMDQQPINRFLSLLSEITLGCTNYKNLIEHGVSEFSERSIICLDSDAVQYFDKPNNFKTVIFLPGELPPDQLIFEYLYNLPADDDFWKNDIIFARPNFTSAASEVMRELSIGKEPIDVKACVAAYNEKVKESKEGERKKPREIFKWFYKDEEFQKLFKPASKKYNPWKHWVENNPSACNSFLQTFELTLRSVMSSSYAVDVDKLAAVKVVLKKEA